MTALYLDIRWPVGLGLIYVLLWLYSFAANEVWRMEANLARAKASVSVGTSVKSNRGEEEK